jgi:hypothetical protein
VHRTSNSDKHIKTFPYLTRVAIKSHVCKDSPTIFNARFGTRLLLLYRNLRESAAVLARFGALDRTIASSGVFWSLGNQQKLLFRGGNWQIYDSSAWDVAIALP